jgi:hypothetical protein
MSNRFRGAPLTSVSLTRRELINRALTTTIAMSVMPPLWGEGTVRQSTLRAINIMNFIRAEEPRVPTDLIEPVREQMALIRRYEFPATWLLQYDAMVEGPYVEFLKTAMPQDHEVGIWFEMNRKICDDAGIAWRGNPDWEWDYHVPVAYSIGYTQVERRKLADTAMGTFRRVWGHDAKAIASWNLDAVSMEHFSMHYGADAFAVVRDQLNTDGYTVWGAPIAGYYPSRRNAWSPALERGNQIPTPVFRLLGQDPVYYYDNRLPNPDTMEPVWPSGQSGVFVEHFLEMIARSPSQSFAYAQLGQENSFGWPMMGKGYALQMAKLAGIRNQGDLRVETMGETGRRFKRSFSSTPTQAQVMLQDPFANTVSPERTVWYQSKYFRANLHFRSNEFYLRDLHVYDDSFAEPYLEETAKRHGIEQRMLAVLDGYHWSDDRTHAGQAGKRAMGRFLWMDKDERETALVAAGAPILDEDASTLRVKVPLSSAGTLEAVFMEREMTFKLNGASDQKRLALSFEWVPERSALQGVVADRLHYRFRSFNYSVQAMGGAASRTTDGVRIVSGAEAEIRLLMAQSGEEQ